MSIVFQDTVRKTPRFDVQLPVELSDLEVTVRAGTFRIDGKSYVLTEDESYTITPSDDERVRAIFYLVEMKSDNSVRLFVDEMVGDEAPIPMIDPKDMNVLHRFISIVLLPEVETLEDDALVYVMRLIPDVQPQTEVK